MTRHWLPMGDEFGEITMAYNGVLLIQVYDWESDAPAKDFWIVAHHASGASMAVLTVMEDRAKDIAAQIAELRDWPKMAARAWEGDAGFIAMIDALAGEAEIAQSTDEIGNIIPYGPSAQVAGPALH